MQQQLSAAIQHFGSIDALLVAVRENTSLRVQLNRTHREMVKMTRMLEDRENELLIFKEKIHTLIGLLAANKDEYDHLLAKTMWTPNCKHDESHCPMSNSTINAVTTTSSQQYHSMDPDPKLMAENEILRQRVNELERELSAMRSEHEESQRMSRGLSREIEEVNARRDSLHLQNERLQCDLNQRLTAIQEMASILNEDHVQQRPSYQLQRTYAVRSLSSFMGPLMADSDVSCTLTPTCRMSAFSPSNNECNDSAEFLFQH